ncbi:hypothetical protein OIU79_029328 [Salix purpurea]|uniref:Uncharacterized protein n=1 Tax=Salix purpurea TaxID=77065 RepID=A0A9Q0VGD0_SALPP|nr:hypothetical protein OIU79_029328 [Salix purpurea]
MVISDAEKRIPVVEMLKSGKVTGSISTNMANGEPLITKRCQGNDVIRSDSLCAHTHNCSSKYGFDY